MTAENLTTRRNEKCALMCSEQAPEPSNDSNNRSHSRETAGGSTRGPQPAEYDPRDGTRRASRAQPARHQVCEGERPHRELIFTYYEPPHPRGVDRQARCAQPPG